MKPCIFCKNLTPSFVKIQKEIYFVKRYICENPACAIDRIALEVWVRQSIRNELNTAYMRN